MKSSAIKALAAITATIAALWAASLHSVRGTGHVASAAQPASSAGAQPSSSLAAAVRDLNFKGISVGKKHTAAEVKAALGVGCGEGYTGLLVCNGKVTVAEVKADVNIVFTAAGTVQRIMLIFKEDSFDAVRGALVQKYGKPTSEVPAPVQNSFGAQYTNETLQWSGASGTSLTASRFAGQRDISYVYFSTPEDDKALAGKSAAERAKDL